MMRASIFVPCLMLAACGGSVEVVGIQDDAEDTHSGEFSAICAAPAPDRELSCSSTVDGDTCVHSCVDEADRVYFSSCDGRGCSCTGPETHCSCVFDSEEASCGKVGRTCCPASWR